MSASPPRERVAGKKKLRHDMLVAADQAEGIADAARRGGKRGAEIGGDSHLGDAAGEAHRGGKIDQRIDRDRCLLLETPDIERPVRIAHAHAQIDAARVRRPHQRIEIAEETAGPLHLAAMSADADAARAPIEAIGQIGRRPARFRSAWPIARHEDGAGTVSNTAANKALTRASRLSS
jgi:hypothetical protein